MLADSLFGNAFSKAKYKWSQGPYFRLFVYIVATSLLLYWQFIFGDKVFASKDYVVDMYQQYLKVYEFFANSLRNGELTSYTFQYGFGNSIFSMLGWISDPFSILGVIIGVIFGVEYIADSMIYILILKHICAGLLCFCYLRGFKYSIKSSMVSAYLYSFAGYMLTMGQHYFFANHPVFFILILVMLEKIINGEYRTKYWCVLLYTSFIITLSGVTSAYEIFLAAGFYTLFRVIYIYGKDYKRIFQSLGICLVFVLGGIILSSFTIMPALDRILGSNRIAQNVNIFSFNTPEVIRAGVLRLFSNHLNGYINQYYGSTSGFNNDFPYFFSVLCVPFMCQYVWRTFRSDYSIKNKLLRLIPVISITFAIVNKFISLLFSFFIPHYHSYIYVIYPFFALVFAEGLDNIQENRFSRLINYISMFISIAFIMWGGITTNYKGSDTALFTFVISILILLIGCFSSDILYLCSDKSSKFLLQREIKKISLILVLLAIVLSSFVENYVMIKYRRIFSDKENSRIVMKTNQIVDGVNYLEGDNFFRFETEYYEGRMFWYTYPFLFPIRATAFYDSAVNNDILFFYKQMYDYSIDQYVRKYQDAKNKANNTITEDLLGLKYLLLTSDPQRSGWEKIEEYPEQGVALYQNMGINSAGLLFDSYITQDEANAMTFNERVIGLPTRLVIDAPSSDIDDFAVKYSKDNDYDNCIGDISENSIVNTDSVLPYNGTVDDVSVTDSGCFVKATMDGDDSNFRFSLNTNILNNSKVSAQITFRLKDDSVLKNFVYCDGADYAWKEIATSEPEVEGGETVYSFIVPQAAIGLALCVNQPCELDVEISTKTVTATYVNEGIQLDNPKRGNIVTGTVDAQQNCLLYLPIPFDKYWNAYIDGEKVDIMKANYAFMAVPVTAGQHRVDFIYSNELYHTFLKVSVATFILYNGFFAFCLIVKYRRKKKGENK